MTSKRPYAESNTVASLQQGLAIDDILYHVTFFLEFKDRFRFQTVCNQWYKIAFKTCLEVPEDVRVPGEWVIKRYLSRSGQKQYTLSEASLMPLLTDFLSDPKCHLSEIKLYCYDDDDIADEVYDKFFNALASCKSCQTLFTNMENSVSRCADLNHLTSFFCQQIRVKGDDLVKLCSKGKLRKLFLNNNRLPISSISAISQCKELRHLRLGYQGFQDEGVKKIADLIGELPSIKKVEIQEQCTFETAARLQTIATKRNIEIISSGGFKIDGETRFITATMTGLKECEPTENPFYISLDDVTLEQKHVDTPLKLKYGDLVDTADYRGVGLYVVGRKVTGELILEKTIGEYGYMIPPSFHHLPRNSWNDHVTDIGWDDVDEYGVYYNDDV